ncbi:unnamed protein product [Caenorhabditis sp. 36 PRJEB53466]|nr:unnamed protein product [Caenorhabditis sp. 36 PRJEB53466]
MMADEELGDEVKVFRQEEDADDDDPMIGGETSEQQLADDKKEAVMEAEMDGDATGASRLPSIGGIKTESFIKAEPSPSFPMMPGLFPGAAFSPSYALPMFMPLIVPPYGLRSPNLMFPMGVSPSFPMPLASPFYGAAMAAAAKQHLENQAPMHMRGPMNPLMRMPPYINPAMIPQHPADRRMHGGGKVKKEDHIKKPLNAFMWFMKENRKKLLEEIGNNEKQSAELNKELGKRWHDLPKEEQQKYFEMAKKDRETHKEKYPQWSARENYAVNKKKTKKRRDKSVASENSDQKKCRARFGVNNQEMWCKFCKRKKKCEYATDRSGSSDMVDALDGRGSSSSLGIGGPSPLASSSTSTGRSPTEEDPNASDSDTDVEEDDDVEIDPTITQQTHELMMQESVCTL